MNALMEMITATIMLHAQMLREVLCALALLVIVVMAPSAKVKTNRAYNL